jgi:hypothetical protein
MPAGRLENKDDKGLDCFVFYSQQHITPREDPSPPLYTLLAINWPPRKLPNSLRNTHEPAAKYFLPRQILIALVGTQNTKLKLEKKSQQI